MPKRSAMPLKSAQFWASTPGQVLRRMGTVHPLFRYSSTTHRAYFEARS